MVKWIENDVMLVEQLIQVVDEMVMKMMEQNILMPWVMMVDEWTVNQEDCCCWFEDVNRC
jgi:hypothetical protein